MNEKQKEIDYESMTPSQLIDTVETIDPEEIDKAYDVLSNKEFFKYLQEQITYNQEQFEEWQSKVNKELVDLKLRLDKIDNFWNISNKLEMILDRLQKRPYKSHRKEI